MYIARSVLPKAIRLPNADPTSRYHSSNNVYPRLFASAPPSDYGPAVSRAVERLATSSPEARGAIYTKGHVVDLILDLVGYVPDADLCSVRILEPSFGAGDFLLPIASRLVASCLRHTRFLDFESLVNCIRAVEVHHETFASTRLALITQLTDAGLAPHTSERLSDAWLIAGDFLLADIPGQFDAVVGNPPYIRQEALDPSLLTAYRQRYATLYDRADIYVPFFERGLDLLTVGGALGYICSDRWVKNKYGGPLRRMVASGFALTYYVDLYGASPFTQEVSAYPAITVIERKAPATTTVAKAPDVDGPAFTGLAHALVAGTNGRTDLAEVPDLADGSAPWIFGDPIPLKILRRAEERFPTLEEAGCRVGIGVASGADKAYIAPYDALDVEPSRKLRLVTGRDIDGSEVRWRGRAIINPYDDDGRLVRLEDYPRLAAYLEARRGVIAKRHVARKHPGQWYKTIDRIHPALTDEPKLLIPDIRGEASIAFEPGGLYPHHNLYWVTAHHWDLRALQAVLKSGVARLFVGMYSLKMRGGYLRFQAQYLRRIRLPDWRSLPEADRADLSSYGGGALPTRVLDAIRRIYGLADRDWRVLNNG